MHITYPLTIFYDASCPICATEMQMIKETDFHNQLILIDCSSQDFTEPAYCPSTKAIMMERIHAVDAAGQWIKGVDVFEAAYQAAGFHQLSRFWGSKTLRPILTRAYPWVADNRHWLSKTPVPFLMHTLLKIFAPK